VELFLDRFPSNESTQGAWTLPRVDAGGIKVPLEALRDIAADDESNRSLPAGLESACCALKSLETTGKTPL
jgi:hypothetical protein